MKKIPFEVLDSQIDYLYDKHLSDGNANSLSHAIEQLIVACGWTVECYNLHSLGISQVNN